MPSLRVLIHLDLANMPATVPRYPRQLNESFREAQINPSIVVIIIILTIIFFLSGCLHLLIRCLVLRNPRRDPNSIVTLTALQGQLQQLFHLHDSGVEQAFIDTLPVFFYKSVTGLKEGADCAVCLCEFEAEDRLRLLPKCSHAFHMDCIDTWLLSHSTCPLCRRSLLPDDVAAIATSHQAGLLLDSSRSSIDAEAVQRAGSDQLASENVSTAAESLDDTTGRAHVACNPTDHVSCKPVHGPEIAAAVELGASVSFPEGHPQTQYAGKVLSVQLGRFRVVEGAAGIHTLQGGVSSSSITGSRRSYSVGSYEYVLDPWSSEVVIAPTPLCKRTGTPRRPSTPGHRATLSECAQADVPPDPLTFARAAPITSNGHHEKPAAWSNCAISSCSMDITAVIHPHLHPPNCTSGDHKNSRRAVSFRQPLNEEAMKLKVSASRRSLSEASEVLRTQDEQQQLHHDPCTFFSGTQLVSASTELSNYSLPSAHQGANHGSFRRGLAPYSLLAKRTFNWLVGRQNRWTASLEASVV